MANIFSNETAKTTEPTSTVQPGPSINWTMKLKLKAAHQALAFLGVADAMIAEADLDKWAKIYELLVGAPPPPKKPS
jgi:hypothetical protein